MTQKIKIGVAGCGAMGLPMARNLIENGFDVCGYDVRPKSEFGDFAKHMCDSGLALCHFAPIVISVVRDWSETTTLCFGENGLFSGNSFPEILVISSTLSPGMIRDLASRVPEETTIIDAPMSGTVYRATEGALTFMLGGDKSAVERLMPVFSAMGSQVNHLGPSGMGMTCKVLNNMLAATSVVAVREVLEAAEKLDFPAETLLRVAQTSSGSTWFGDNLDKIHWAGEGYSLTNTIGILEKDVNSLLDATSLHPELRINEFAKTIISELRNLRPVAKP